MKKNLFNLSALLITLVFVVSGCKKDEDKPAPVVSPGREIVSFRIVNPAVTAVIDTVAKTITATVPNGTAINGLVTEISLAAGHSINPASGASQDFTNPVTYTVKRPDNTTTSWTVKVIFPDVVVEDDITQSVTWTADRVYTINSDISISNSSVLTIQPGTIIRFGAYGSLTIGYGSNATVNAVGTADKPIIFTSSALLPTAGAWNGLYFYDKTLSNSILSYCKILYAGKDSYDGALNLLGCDITMTNCTIENSGSYGILTTYSDNKGGFVTYDNNTINKTAKYAIQLHANKISKIGTGNVFTETQGIHITGDFKSTEAETWKNPGVPYIITEELDVDGSLTLTAGSVFKFGADASMEMGYSQSTSFVAEGTATAPITFTSSAASPAAGAWQGIVLWDNVSSNSKMNYCIIEYAGSSSYDGALTVKEPVSFTFTNNIIRKSSSYGITLEYNAGFQAFSGNTISECSNHLITISVKHLPELGSSNILTPSSNKGIFLSGDVKYADPVTWKKQTADFYVSDEIDIDGILTIEPGCKFLFDNDGFFWFGYSQNTKITAVGTSDKKITFTSSSASPVAGTWKGLRFDQYVQTNSSFDYCTFQYTGFSGKPALFTETSFNVSNTTVSDFTGNAAEYQSGTTAPAGTGNNFTWTAGSY
ncbi:MAG TPA: hypothetical protein VHO46_14640 [Bacteroidales bacterium]|nr:hypothetical protein [Bacteroidales bacterium]